MAAIPDPACPVSIFVARRVPQTTAQHPLKQRAHAHGVRFHVDRPLVLRLERELQKILDPSGILSPGSRPPQIPKCSTVPHDFALPFTVDDEPRLTIRKKTEDDWIYLALTSRRASLDIHMQLGVAFHMHEWLADAARAPSSSRRALGRRFCDVPWHACPNCLGEPLSISGGIGSCRQCGGRWLKASDSLCGLEATHQITAIATGQQTYSCSSHAELARRQITDAVVEALPVVPS